MDEPLPGGRAGNLFEPVPGSYGAHGRFDREARGRSLQLWLNLHRRAVLVGVLGAAAGLAILLRLLAGS